MTPWLAVLPYLLQCGYRATNTEGAAEAPPSSTSVGNALRSAMVTILRSRLPGTLPWREKLFTAMQAMKADVAAEQAKKYIERQEYKER